MSLTLHYHPLSSFCQKVLIGLYEAELPFEKRFVDLGDPAQRAALVALWAAGKFPVLRDESRARTVPESTIILEYLDQNYSADLVPQDKERALDCRFWDRFFDLQIHLPMQAIVGDRLRPMARRDPLGVSQAEARLTTGYAILEAELGTPWALGQDFTLADCSAAPALFYAQQVFPFAAWHERLAAYYARLLARPSFARVLAEAKPFWSSFPGEIRAEDRATLARARA